MEDDPSVDRRTALKLTGGAAAAGMVGSATAGAKDTVETVISDRLNPASPTPQEALVIFTNNAAVDRLAELDVPYRRFEVLPIGWTELTGDEMRELAGFDDVRRIEANYELELLNHTAKESNNVGDIRQTEDLDYRGEGIHAAVIDTGINPQHPGFDNIVANYEFVGDPLWTYNAVDEYDPLWIDAGPSVTDDEGHGTHCAGSLAGSGDGSLDDNDYSGMAPQANLTIYDVNVNQVVLNAEVTAAYDHMVARQREGEQTIHLTSNSYGGGAAEFDPWGPVAVAWWYAFAEGMVVLQAAGNSGSDPDTLSSRARAPFVFSVAAADADDSVSGFSSRGVPDGNFQRRPALRRLAAFYDEHIEDYNWCFAPDCEVEPADADGGFALERPGVIAKGGSVVSAVSPEQTSYGLTVLNATDDPFYGGKSGTSMSCPTAAGVVACFLSAWKDQHAEIPDPIETITTIEATANSWLSDDYDAITAGAGHVDAKAAVNRALEGELATADEITFENERKTQEDIEGCVETVQSINRKHFAYASSSNVVVSLGTGTETTMSLTDEFAQSPFSQRRLVVTVEDELTDVSVSIGRKVGSADGGIIGIGESGGYERIGYISSETLDESPQRIVIKNGETYTGEGVNGDEVENEVILDDGETYRVQVDNNDAQAGVEVKIKAELQSYELGCFD